MGQDAAGEFQKSCVTASRHWNGDHHQAEIAPVSGRSASRDQVTRVLYLVSRFNPVLEIGDVECYHIGSVLARSCTSPPLHPAHAVCSDDLLVEVDVILPKSSTLHFAHDVGETIQ